jgi:hypothetical protein
MTKDEIEALAKRLGTEGWPKACAALRALSAERDTLAAKVAELEQAWLDAEAKIEETPCPLCHQPSDGRCVGKDCPVGAAIPGEPVAWRVKDFADGWILCATEKQAQREARDCGNLVQPLYLAAAPQPPSSASLDPIPAHEKIREFFANAKHAPDAADPTSEGGKL